MRAAEVQKNSPTESQIGRLMNHIRKSNGDGPAGVSLSWPAISAIIASLSLLFVLLGWAVRIDKGPVLTKLADLEKDVEDLSEEFHAALSHHAGRPHEGAVSEDVFSRVERDVRENTRLLGEIKGRLEAMDR